jgi:phenylacetate-CoA ligase
VSGHLPTLLRHFWKARQRFRSLRGKGLADSQDERARETIAHARAHSPYYQALFEDLDPADWRSFPTTDKAAMMAHFDAFNTAGVKLENAMRVALRAEDDRDFTPKLNGLTVGLSSGTSGHRGLFLLDDRERAAWAGTVLARLLPPFRPRGYRVAFFLRSSSNLYTTLRSRWLDFRYFDLMLPLADAVRALNDLQPDLLAGPPSLLVMLAAAAGRGELRIRPQKVISFAEVLEPEERARIESGFHQPVHEVYQCTEGLLAISCPEGRLHVQEDLVALQAEPLGDDRSTPIVTDLWRRVQPIIRYRLNDVIRFSADPCPCGSAFRALAGIEGRCDDVCYFTEPGGGRRAVFPDTIRRVILMADPEIAEYQAVQERDGAIRIRLELTPEADFDPVAERVRCGMEAALTEYGCRAEAIAVERGLEPRPAGAKNRRVQRTAGRE